MSDEPRVDGAPIVPNAAWTYDAPSKYCRGRWFHRRRRHLWFPDVMAGVRTMLCARCGARSYPWGVG